MFNIIKTYQEFDAETGDTVNHGLIYHGEGLSLKDLLYSLDGMGFVEVSRRHSKSGVIIELTAHSVDPEIDYNDGSQRVQFAEITGPARALARLPKLIRWAC